MKKCTLLVLMALISHQFTFAQLHLLNEFSTQPTITANTHSQRFSPNGIEGTLTETLDFVFDSITAVTPVNGFNAAMLLPDGTLWKRASGLSTEFPFPMPLTTEHLMGMGSITKSFVSLTLLHLYEDGLLDLSDSIGKFVGPYPNVPGGVTIRQLLSHRSGINDYLNENPAMINAWVANLDSIWVADTILNNYILAPNFPVDSSWSYSNTNFLLAARIIEHITGQPWYQVVREKVLDPIGLAHTFAYPWETPGSQPISHVWLDIDGNGTVEDAQGLGLPVEGLFSLAGGAGCLISTPEDLVNFSDQLYGGHILLPATLAEMETDHIQDGSGFLYGLGTASFPLPQNLSNWGHDGNLFYKSIALYLPAENVSLAVQQNDDRYFDPSQPDPVYDLNIVFLFLLDAYLNYTPISAAHDIDKSQVSIRLSPNPATDLLTIEIEENDDIPLESIQIVNAYGQLIRHYKWEDCHTLSVEVSTLTPGVYFAAAVSPGHKLTAIRKVVIE